MAMRLRPGEPGLAFEVARPRPQPSPVRSDVAGLLVRTRRGPLGRLVRVDGWRQCRRVFGGLVAGAIGPYAMRGYFENGGEVAHLWRLAGPGAAAAEAAWHVDPVVAARGGFATTLYRFVASSPGAWGNGLAVSARYRLRGRLGAPEIDVVVRAPDEPSESFRAVAPSRLPDVINGNPDEPAGGSALVRLIPEPLPPPPPPAGWGPAVVEWDEEDFVFALGADDPPRPQEYAAGGQALLDEPEVAMIAVPDLPGDLDPGDVDDWVTRAVTALDPLHDRLLLLDVPAATPGAVADSHATARWLRGLRDRNAGGPLRNATVWHPPLWAPDPLGGAADPLKLVPASGHVAGVVSRLDRERGPHWTPANAECVDAVDVGAEWPLDEREALYREGVNLVRCLPGKGLQLWGAWTAVDPRSLDNPSYLYLSHRRLVHRLVRVLRTIAEPLLFQANTREFRFSIYRAVYGVLLRFWRAGAFKGARPEEAFTVVCDDSNNPPEAQADGRVWCEIGIAPAAPMEFITLRIALGEAGRLEVFA
jgi:Bacteriophage tail sheath protein